jgi:hypothetical protein
MTPELEVRAVVDKSALRSYARGHVHVGEIIREIADEPGAVVAVPALALLRAHADLAGNARHRAVLRVITTVPGVVVMDVGEHAADRMAGVVVVTGGDLPKAHVVWTANRHRALLLTSEPDEVKHLIPEANIIPISTDDA